MIIPLYDRSAHNMRPNTVVDAGTDARFHKRSLEIADLAMLDPVEVWVNKDGKPAGGGGADGAAPDQLGVPIRRTSSLPHGPSGSRACTPDPASSAASVASDQSCASHPHPAGTPALTPTPTPTRTPTLAPIPPPPAGGKKMFGLSKLFRKEDGATTTSAPNSKADAPSTQALLPSISVAPAPSTPAQSVPVPVPARADTPMKQPAKPKPPPEIHLPAVLDITPALAGGRCVAYVWAVSRWLKTDDTQARSGRRRRGRRSVLGAG
jgi:hypothetical protein